MNWMPISEAALWDELNAAQSRMNPPQLRLWDAIRVSPSKWKEERYGVPGGGFWVVAILGSLVVWYNDIEYGFNYSKYSHFGVIDEYWCNQDELEHTTQRLLVYVQTGQIAGPRVSPPLAGVYGGA